MTGIEKTPAICGGNPCIAQSRAPVWSLVQTRGLGFTDDLLLPRLLSGKLSVEGLDIHFPPGMAEEATALS